MLVVLYFEDRFNERVEGGLVQVLKIRADVVGQLVDAPMVGSSFFQKVFDPSVFIRQLFVYHLPGVVVL